MHPVWRHGCEAVTAAGYSAFEGMWHVFYGGVYSFFPPAAHPWVSSCVSCEDLEWKEAAGCQCQDSNGSA